MSGPPSATEVRSTGIGSWPGTDIGDALKISFAECPTLPYLPELPARGPYAGIIGRGTVLLSGLGIELHATGWRLTDIAGRDQRRAISLWRSDLDRLEEIAQDFVGEFKIATAGPWTLAAALEHPRGDKIIADRGARRDVVQSLTEGLVQLVGELRRRLPALATVIQLDEPSLPAVLAGGIATASGLHRHRAVDLPEVSGAFSATVEQLRGGRADGSDVAVWVHSCAPGVPITLLRGAGVGGLLLDLDQVGVRDWDALGPAVEGGMTLGLGVQPSDRVVSADELAERPLRVLRPLELGPGIAGRVVLTPACGLSGVDASSGVMVMRNLRIAAGIVTEQLGH